MRASGSIPANYIEANESPGEQDKKMHSKICRKESKKSHLWLKHILTNMDEELEKERLMLIQETIELENIFATIHWKLEMKTKKQSSSFQCSIG